jgi:hypothetical protein
MANAAIERGKRKIFNHLLFYFEWKFLERPEVAQYIETILTGVDKMGDVGAEQIAKMIVDDLNRWRATLLGQPLPPRFLPPRERTISPEVVLMGRRERVTEEDVNNYALDGVINAQELMNNLMMVFVLTNNRRQLSNN